MGVQKNERIFGLLELAALSEVPYQFTGEAEAEGLIIPNKERSRPFQCYRRKLAS